jgi:hypothetical protein
MKRRFALQSPNAKPKPLHCCWNWVQHCKQLLPFSQIPQLSIGTEQILFAPFPVFERELLHYDILFHLAINPKGKTMARIHRLLNALRDETGVINPTRFRKDDNDNFICDPIRELKLPIQFIRHGGYAHEILLPNGSTGFFSRLEINFALQQLIQSPYVHWMREERSVSGEQFILTITEYTNTLALPLSVTRCLPLKPIELWKGGRHWYIHLQYLRDLRITRRKIREWRREEREHHFLSLAAEPKHE